MNIGRSALHGRLQDALKHFHEASLTEEKRKPNRKYFGAGFSPN
jgi:hypothetical protein